MLKVYHLSESRINEELLARGSRISGTREQKQDRLQRFLDFENQKERRNQYVQQRKAETEEKNRCDDCSCKYEDNEKEKDERAAETLLNLRQNAWFESNIRIIVQSLADMEENYEVVVAENVRLNNRVNNLETRLSHLENRSDSPPPLSVQDSNPQWVLDTAFMSNL